MFVHAPWNCRGIEHKPQARLAKHPLTERSRAQLREKGIRIHEVPW